MMNNENGIECGMGGPSICAVDGCGSVAADEFCVSCLSGDGSVSKKRFGPYCVGHYMDRRQAASGKHHKLPPISELVNAVHAGA